MGVRGDAAPRRRENPVLAEEEDLQNSLRTFRPNFLNDLIRLGRDFDGGYVVNERAIRLSRYLLSFGVNDDWSFEASFRNQNPDAQILCFDHSVSKEVLRERFLDALNQILSARFVLGALSLNFRGVRNKFRTLRRYVELQSDFSSFFSSKNVRLFSRGVSNASSPKFFTINEVFQMIPPDQLDVENSVFVKMDIEQSEFRVLPDLLRFDKCLGGMVVEFHDLDILWPNFLNLMNQMRAKFEITHMHGNNFGDLIPNSRTPKLLEVTFLKRDLIRAEEPRRDAAAYPIPGLDQPNDRSKEDYPLYF
jgi:hypothetical protein